MSQRDDDRHLPEHAGWTTDYDRAHLTIYSALLRAERDGIDWRDAARRYLDVDADVDEARARHIWDENMKRALWFWGAGT